MDRDELLRVLRAFEEEGLEYVLTARTPRPGGGFERFLRHCARYWRVAPRGYPRGVFRFRSVEEAQAARAQVTKDNATPPVSPASA